MFFNRMVLKPEATRSALFWKNIGNEYFLHQAVWQAFGDNPDRRRDFLYRLDNTGMAPIVYTVSERRPPEETTLWLIASKPYTPRISEGARLGFILRASPTFKRNGKRHDVVMDSKLKLKKDSAANEPTMEDIVFEAGAKWLAVRAEKHGFQVETLRTDGYRQYKFFGNNGKVAIRYSRIDFRGVLTVKDQSLFTQMLFKGIGPEKGFGCGLMLVHKI